MSCPVLPSLQMLTLWLWLSLRMSNKDLFVGRSVAQAELEEVQYGLARLLELITGTQLAYKPVGSTQARAAKRRSLNAKQQDKGAAQEPSMSAPVTPGAAEASHHQPAT